MSQAIADRLKAPGRKRLLALDGGGTRGIVTIGFLAEMERTLQRKLGRDDSFVLSDYFDLIGGTSVGSMIATLLAMGWRVERIETTFREWAPDIFRTRWLGSTYLRPRFKARVLDDRIARIVGDAPLKAELLKTGLAIVTKRADTGSVWVLTNNPAAKYWHGSNGEVGNKDYRLRDIIRASTAAPTYFRPMRIAISTGKGHAPVDGLFMDGGVSPFNNPALLLFKLAGLSGYNLGGADLAAGEPGRRWAHGEDELLLISVGTGSFSTSVGDDYRLVVRQAVDALQGMMDDTRELGTALLQWMGRTRRPWHIDGEIGDLASDNMTVPAMLSFQRYDIRLEADWLSGKETTGVVPGEQLRAAIREAGLDVKGGLGPLRRMDAPDQMGLLSRLAAAAAREQVSPLDFPDVFDEVWRPESAAPTPA